MFSATAPKIAARVQSVALQTRNMTVVSGPPQVKVSAAEKLAHGVVITVGILAIPLWVLANIRNYRGADK